MSHDEKLPIAVPLDQFKQLASATAEEMKAAETMSASLRERFINVRGALFQRGIYDPVLVRFDSYTAPKASVQEVGEQLAVVAESL